MKRPADTFVLPPEMGQRLKDLRLRAGLNQQELAQAMGRAGRGGANIVSRLEKATVRYPSFGLIADFLRACRAGFGDILDLLDLYTRLPTTQEKVFDKALAKVVAQVPERWQAQVENYDLRLALPKPVAKPAQERAMPDRLKRLERARRTAAAAKRRYLYGQFLMEAVNETGLAPTMGVREPLFNHGLEWFRILARTRKARPGVREKQLAESEAKFEKASRFPLEAVRKLQDDVRRHFGEMEMRGDLDWLPDLTLGEYEAGLLAPARKRSLKREQHDEFVRKLAAYNAAKRAAVEQVWRDVQPILDEAGVTGNRRALYRRLVGACCTDVLNSAPGVDSERREVEAFLGEPRWIHLGLDTVLARKLADVAIPRLSELARSLPPAPYSKHHQLD